MDGYYTRYSFLFLSISDLDTSLVNYLERFFVLFFFLYHLEKKLKMKKTNSKNIKREQEKIGLNLFRMLFFYSKNRVQSGFLGHFFMSIGYN